MTTCEIILTPTTEEPKICHVLAITSALNLKLCRMRDFKKQTILQYLDGDKSAFISFIIV